MESDGNEKEENDTTEPESDNPVEPDVDTDSELTELDAEVILRDLGSRGRCACLLALQLTFVK